MAADNEVSEMATSQVAGTVGYSDPLYTRTGVVSESSECYSFGQVLIEILVGRPPAVLAKDGHSCVFLSDELRPKEDRAKTRVLSRLDMRAQWPLCAAAGLATLALLCIHEDADRRPTFLEATDMLRDLTAAAAAQEAAQDGGCRDSAEQQEVCHQAIPLAKPQAILTPGREDSTSGCSPENALKQPEFPQLESAEVLGQLLQHAQHVNRPALQANATGQRSSPSRNYVHPKQGLPLAQVHVRASPVQQHRQQTQALSPGTLMQMSPTAVQVWQPVSPGGPNGPNGPNALQLLQVAACPRPINRPCGPLGAASPHGAHLQMTHAKSMQEMQAESKGIDLGQRASSLAAPVLVGDRHPPGAEEAVEGQTESL
ncbi:BAM2 [Symbiodinium pilosum]|uniref:BAM2 protein n=1 Tax=Symbiodinium pilosum TaxID=2952 RepID=A0A812T3H7_SYMPI|nr:BAM2 [Symbiodinium pilosum]